MSEDRGRRTGPRKSSAQGSSSRPTSGRSTGGQRGSDSGASAKGSYRQGGKPTGERRGGAGKPSSDRRGAGKPGDDRRGGAGRPQRRVTSEPGPRTKDQAVYDGPPLPEEITGQELDASVRAQLRGIPEKLGQRVARHLVAAGELVDSDPEIAYQHALAARARAPRIAVVREAAGETAYAAGHYAEALAELRAAKRMNGATAYLPIMADCHRALGNAKRAIELAKSPSVARFPTEAKAEMTIVEAGARRDLGQMDAALRTLELAPLNNKSRESWVVRLRYAYADTLEQAGRPEDALAWFHRTNAIDGEELTDAAERAEALEKQLGQ
ncbi:MAG TPA: tetratricopeptide repeat protein [Nocardioides sp.]|nr:tetratricopeptide repeat protein [Nocardioides sp.]